MTTLNNNIKIVNINRKKHSKASEEYIHVVFNYPKLQWDGWVPVEYRRTGVSISSEEELFEYLNSVYEQMQPENFSAWYKDQELFWANEKPNATTTKPFFDSLVKGGWQCVECVLPKNPNWARRIQDLKEFGYTLATDISHYCPHCKQLKTHILLLPLTRGGIGNGYETWSPALRKRIIKVLNQIDVYECKPNVHCLPDHKFPEIRWGEDTKSENLDNMTDNEIRKKFQLLTNQRNQQKREVCRSCFQTNIRGEVFGIPFFYKGNSVWDKTISKKGKSAEQGCIGCPWYDMEEWRKNLLKKLSDN